MIRFVIADLRRHWPGVVAVVVIVALATALGVVVTLQERALRLGSARAAAAFDLVIGAPGSETQLVLSSVFLQPAPLPLMPGRVLASLRSDPRVAFAAPVGFGDFAGSSPIVGTSPDLVQGLGGLADGRAFARLNEAVVGAGVAMTTGNTIHPLHGDAGGPGHAHAGVSYTVVGRMAPTGTAWDRAVLVPIEAVWRIHGLHGAADAGAHDHEHEDHDDAVDLDASIDPQALSAPEAPGLPAILIKPRSIADAYTLRQQWRTEHTLAVFPAEVLTRLFGTLGDARTILSVVAAGAQALVAVAILLLVVVHVMQRRRQIGALRAFGARPQAIFAIVWLETLAIAGTGLVAGYGIGFAVACAVSATLARAGGFALPIAFAPSDASGFAILVLASGTAALAPAILAYRQSPAASLRA